MRVVGESRRVLNQGEREGRLTGFTSRHNSTERVCKRKGKVYKREEGKRVVTCRA